MTTTTSTTTTVFRLRDPVSKMNLITTALFTFQLLSCAQVLGGEKITLRLDNEAVEDEEGEWTVPLRCGPITSLSTPTHSAYLHTPDGEIIESSTITDGDFVFLLKQGSPPGRYTCTLSEEGTAAVDSLQHDPQHLLALPPYSPPLHAATLDIDRLLIRLAITDANLGKATQQRKRLEAEILPKVLAKQRKRRRAQFKSSTSDSKIKEHPSYKQYWMRLAKLERKLKSRLTFPQLCYGGNLLRGMNLTFNMTAQISGLYFFTWTLGREDLQGLKSGWVWLEQNKLGLGFNYLANLERVSNSVGTYMKAGTSITLVRTDDKFTADKESSFFGAMITPDLFGTW